MLVEGQSMEGFEKAFDDAVTKAPGSTVPRRYELRRVWVDQGGVVGRMYGCEVEVSGPDVPTDR
ncbi:hypothetical protein ASF88_15650 [Leifsonia sp. Leaf336]|uniref:hypothetical protein n=1 Tax=Leifsonia sp. Leaf336 TaxID=1736341 RepID=UPI0006F1E94B|nr:hypothetical protein [Leifsonia sp. Leaf336]KQR50679.1 hypothetical protein ASF88_15650 [Leifsonia sp. Leaf336]